MFFLRSVVKSIGTTLKLGLDTTNSFFAYASVVVYGPTRSDLYEEWFMRRA